MSQVAGSILGILARAPFWGTGRLFGEGWELPRIACALLFAAGMLGLDPAWAREPASPVLDPQVSRALEQGPVRVILDLRLPGGYTPEGQLSPDGRRLQREAIRAVQEKVTGRLKETGARPGRRFRTTPAMAMVIGREGLGALMKMGDLVAGVRLDAPLHPQQKGP